MDDEPGIRIAPWIALPRPPRGPGDGDDDESPMGDPPDEDDSDDPDDEDEGEEDDEPLHSGPSPAALRASCSRAAGR